MRDLRVAGSIRANSPKLKNHRLSRWIFIVVVHDFRLKIGFELTTGRTYSRLKTRRRRLVGYRYRVGRRKRLCTKEYVGFYVGHNSS